MVFGEPVVTVSYDRWLISCSGEQHIFNSCVRGIWFPAAVSYQKTILDHVKAFSLLAFIYGSGTPFRVPASVARYRPFLKRLL